MTSFVLALVLFLLLLLASITGSHTFVLTCFHGAPYQQHAVRKQRIQFPAHLILNEYLISFPSFLALQ